MNKYRLLLIPFTLFVILAIAYTIDPNRKLTKEQMSEKSQHISDDYMLSSLNVTAFAQDRNRLVWIGTSAGINVFNGHDYIQFFHDATDSTALPDDYINCLHLDRNGNMWVGTQNGLARYDGGYHFRRFKLPEGANENIINIYDDSTNSDTGAIVVSTKKSSYSISSDGTLKKTTSHKQDNHNIAMMLDTAILSKPADIISTLYTDADHNTWIGYRNAGYEVLSDNIIAYRKANANTLAKTTKEQDIIGLAATSRHIIAGTTRRLYIYDWQTGHIGMTFYKEFSDNNHTEGNDLNNIVEYGQDGAWVISKRQVVSCAFNTTSTSVKSKTASSTMLGCGIRMGNNLYVSTDGGYILRFRFGDTHADTIHINSKYYDAETQFAALDNNRLLLFMKGMAISVLNTVNGTLTQLKTNAIRNAINADPAFVRTDSRHNIWLGTKRSGLYRLDMKRHRIERMKFPNDVHIQGLIEDGRGQIWITTLKNVICYQPQTGNVLMNSLASSSQDMGNRQFFDNSLCVAPNGGIVIGSSDGCVFLPSEISGTKQAKSDLCVYRFETKTRNGKVYTIGSSITDESHFTLGHDENEFSLHLFYPNYARRSSLMYQYKLDGYDQSWRTPTYDAAVHYANLKPGKYTFHARLVSSPDANSTSSTTAEHCFTITIKPAPWNSWAAWTLYITVVLYAIYYFNTLYLNIRTNRIRLIQEHNELKREQRTNEMNMSFFANISHEFRNPITIIAGPLIALRSDTTLPAHMRQSLDRVCISVNRMLRLIDQMLDFNQLETDALRLKVANTDAAEELRHEATAYEESTKVRGIRLELNIPDQKLPMPLDCDKFEKIMSNLFTNALKHTPDNGCITINMCSKQKQDSGQWLMVEVKNSGSHIADDRLQDVFKRYYQLSDTNTRHKYGWGTGIGLYYVKRLVGLHHGYIDVRNVSTTIDTDKETEGVAFTFCLPMSSSAYADTETAGEPTHVMQIPVNKLPDSDANKDKDTTQQPKTKLRNRKKILIVDDDIDVAAYIRTIFAADYTVENRYTAESALADMHDIRPDIILSDIIMGEMSGYDFCRTLKADLMWSHIPVVLITAKSNMDEQISGLRLGAVAYVTKPFDPLFLRALVESQLGNIESLRHRLGDSTSTDDVAGEMSEQDRRFMDELYSIMERRSSELELSVSTVCHDMLISQSKFNYKVKELTGDTPGTFFRKYRLNKAARLLRQGNLNVSEVATITGFGSAAHFCVAFKKQFGVAPSDYSVHS